jgi:hypothetical protein
MEPKHIFKNMLNEYLGFKRPQKMLTSNQSILTLDKQQIKDSPWLKMVRKGK